ncbi:MAG: hypothetical protein WA947_15065 [Phormidesmis sp.]
MDSFFNAALENQLLSVLAALSFVLLIVVTLGVIYLTTVEWRDRRKRGNEIATMPRLATKAKGKSKSKKKKEKAQGK